MSVPEPIKVAGFPGLVAKGTDNGNGGTGGKGGKASPIVILHSAFADHRPYENYLSHFSDAGHDSYAISRRGRAGRPSSELENIAFNDYRDDVFAVLDEIEGDPVVIGHSLGGVLGQKVAEAGRCKALVLIAAAPPWALPPGLHSTLALGTSMPSIMLGRPFMVPESGAARLLLNAVPEPDRSEIYSRFPRESGAVFRQLLMGTVRVDKSKVRCPVLYVRGGADRVVPRWVGESIAKRYGGDYKEYPGFGHWFAQEPGWEQPAADILNWIQNHDEGNQPDE